MKPQFKNGIKFTFEEIPNTSEFFKITATRTIFPVELKVSFYASKEASKDIDYIYLEFINVLKNYTDAR